MALVDRVHAVEAVGVFGGEWSGIQRGRKRGIWHTFRRWAQCEGVHYELRWSDQTQQAELVVEWNPNHEGVGRSVGYTLRAHGVEDVGRSWVERVDVAFDAARDPFMVLLDYPFCSKSCSAFGLTASGYQTLAVGYGRGEKRKVRRYDKRAKCEVDGEEVGDRHWCRVELEALPPFSVEPLPSRCGEGLPSGDTAAGDVRLRDLAGIACPLREHGGVVELVRSPGDFADERFLALGCVALVMGPKSVRACARKLLGGKSGVERAEFALFDDVTPQLRAAFDAQWASVVRGVFEDLGT